MEKQASNTVDMGAIVRGFVAYAESTETIERAQSVRFESRKIVADFVRANHGKDWKKIQKPIKAAIDGIAVGLVKDKIGLLGVVKTCIEYSIMPTTLNADRLRKAKTWISVDGKSIPNGYNKVHAEKPALAPEAPPAPTSKLESFQKAVDALLPPETAPEGPKVVPVKPATPQKSVGKGEVVRVNVSGDSEAPISSREHCAILLDQLFKNDAFRAEFAPILATMLDSNVATVTRCLVESRDLFCKGGM
jgi:hypothetical protein